MTGKSLSYKSAHKLTLRGVLTKYWQLYLLFIPVAVWYILFSYAPMASITIAFKKFSVIRGIADSPWVGWENFEQMFAAPMFWRAFRNTLIISAQNLIFGFPAPIIFALLLNEMTTPRFKKVVQTISYLPHFISWSVAGGLVYMLLSLNTGIKYPRVLNKRVIKATLHITALSQYPQAELSPTKCPKHSLA